MREAYQSAHSAITHRESGREAAVVYQGGGREAATDRLERACLWLLAALGCLVLIEPAPYEFFFIITLVVFAVRGLSFPVTLYPLLICLSLFAVGGIIALSQAPLVKENITFVAVSVYLLATTLFFAAVISERTAERLQAIRSGYVAGAVVASLFAFIGQFDIGGLGAPFTLHGRASGTFKDPNVLGAFLVPAACFVLQDLLLARGRFIVLAPAGLAIAGALFFSFSRGAWANMAMSFILIIALSYIFAARPVLRLRALVIGCAAVAAAVLLIVVALSIDDIRTLFETRARLDQSYDVGETGRFGRQLRAIPLLLDSPLGLGPFEFGQRFGEAPHNVYINAFSAYGWLGGFAYLALVVITLMIGAGLMISQSGLRDHAIAVFVPFLAVVVQAVQIDTDHWRHVFLLIGIVWGLHAALWRERRGTACPPDSG